MTTLKYMLGAGLLLCLSSSYVSAKEPPQSTSAMTGKASQPSVRTVNYRKNIDELTPYELAAYEHAVEMMKHKSQENVYDRTGFIWQAWVHNCPAVDVLDGRLASLTEEKLKKLLGNPNLSSCNVRNFLSVKGSAKTHSEYPGECEHRKNTFLQWHRAELYYYEQALQAADPDGLFGPSTKNVSLPYWNFTKRPTGQRYPKAFENPNSPLFDSTRNTAHLSSPLPTASPYLLSYIINYKDWQAFGGDEYGTGAGGDLETKIHNQMHATYIGGNMGDNTTAGLDPIFYVFHNFIDHSFEKWIETHGEKDISGNGRTNYMRAEQNDDLLNPVGFNEGSGDIKRTDSGKYIADMGQAELYFDTKKQGYQFEPSSTGEFIPKDKIQALIDKHEQAGFVFGENKVSLFSALLSYGSSGAAAAPQV
ncbi:MAG: tyrosinase family protein, partial [Gammaproteobacteria bacterium]